MGEERYVICQSCKSKSKVTTNTTGSAVDPDLYDAFTHALRGPMLTAESDYIYCNDEELILESRKFNPNKILKLLIERATRDQTSPDIFHKEMKELMLLQIKSKTDFEKNDKGEKYDWFVRFEELQLKYGIVIGTIGSNDPESVTLSRLQCIFSHLYLPLVPNHYYAPDPAIPNMYQYLEFGGVIPSAGKLPLLVRRAILAVHLYCLCRLNTSTAFRTHHLLIDQQIKTGLLSNERRIRFLINNDVLLLSKEMSPATEAALQRVRHLNEKFEDKIMWDLLDCI